MPSALVTVSSSEDTGSKPSLRPAIIFACTSISGKRATFTDLGSKVQYTYGPIGSTADITVLVDRTKAYKAIFLVDEMAALGAGPNYYEFVSVNNDGTVYTGGWIHHRSSGDDRTSISVVEAGKTLADTSCSTDVVDNINSANLRKE